MIRMTCSTKLHCLNRRIGTTKITNKYCSKSKEKTILWFLLWLYCPPTWDDWHGMIDMGMWNKTNDHSRIHFSKRSVNTDVHCTEKESIPLVAERTYRTMSWLFPIERLDWSKFESKTFKKIILRLFLSSRGHWEEHRPQKNEIYSWTHNDRFISPLIRIHAVSCFVS